MTMLKFLHVLCVFIWVGNLLAITRLMGYQVNEEAQTQLRMARIYKRMHTFISLPTMILTVVTGSLLIMQLNQEYSLLWFFHKISFAVGLIVCDVVCGHFVQELNQNPDTSKGIKYKILHGVVGLLLIGVLASIYIFRPYVA